MKILARHWITESGEYKFHSTWHDNKNRCWKSTPARLITITENIAKSFNETWAEYYGTIQAGDTAYKYKTEMLFNTTK